MARFGKNVVWESKWQPDEFAKMQKSMADQYPKVVQDINQLVLEVAQLISDLPADQLLHRGWWEMVGRHVNIKSESDVGEDQIISVRMIDYVQSVIASVEPAPKQRDEVTEQEWKALTGKIKQLFQTINSTYQICLSAKNKVDSPKQNEHFEEFKFKAQLHWCNLRGKRFQVHEPAHLRDMFLTHSEVLNELFGINGEQFIESIIKIGHNLTLGLPRLIEEFHHFNKDVQNALKVKIGDQISLSESELLKLTEELIHEKGWKQRRDEVFDCVSGIGFFDLQKITNLPQKLLDELTWSPGQEKDFFAEGDFRGWPLRIWPVFKRPFILINKRYCCFDVYSLFDNLYRVMQRIILRLKPEYAETWKLKQQEQSEALPLKYLLHVLPEASAWRQVFYPRQAETGKKEWCEADGLLVYDDHLFIIESRGGAFTYTSPANDFQAYVTSLENLVLKPATQGKRFLDYLNSADSVSLFDNHHQKIGELRHNNFRHVTICPVTLDPFTELAAQVQHLRKIGVDVGAHPVWAISLDDLRVYADVFENSLTFLHFVEQRMQAFKSDIIQSEDELDHLGLYLEHNHYSLHAEQLRGTSDARMVFNGYCTEIEKFFSSRSFDPKTPCLLKQKTPSQLLEIIEFLTHTNLSGRSQIASFLLDSSGEWREQLSRTINEELVRQPSTRRPKPMSSHGDVNVTVYCWTPSSLPQDSEMTLNHTQTVLLVNGETERLLLELVYDYTASLRQVYWKWVDKASISAQSMPKLEADAAKLRQQRVAKAKAERRKIGVNERCPCGSGKKYKKCCR